MLGLTLALGGVAAAPFVLEALRQPVDGTVKSQAPGLFAALPQGTTHFRWFGPEGGPVIVMVHGLSSPSVIFAALATCLAARGARVLTYDLYGRGYSDRVSGPQDARFFLDQLDALLRSQDVASPVSLIGYSMGGAIVARFAAEAPDRVARLHLLAPAGLSDLSQGWAGRIRRAPGLGDWMVRGVGAWSLRRSLPAPASETTATIAEIARETERRGYLPAVLSSYRHLLRGDCIEAHREIAARGIPVRAIWGDEDAVIPVAQAVQLTALNPDAENVILKGAGHALPLTHAGAVAAVILR